MRTENYLEEFDELPIKRADSAQDWEDNYNTIKSFLSSALQRAREEERERIRLLFREHCDKNLKEYGGAFVSYEFEHIALTANNK